jgi:hypothetical protein
MGLRVEFWWWCEKRAGRLWYLVNTKGDGSIWLDWLPAFCSRRRYAAERAWWKGREGDPYRRDT